MRWARQSGGAQGGPLRVGMHPPGNPLCEAVLDAASQMGVKRVADMNDVAAVSQGGMSYQPVTTWRGRRFSAARAFLDPVRTRPNLDVETGTDALRIEFVDHRAASVVLRAEAGPCTVQVRREIILSAGAIHSPKLLQLSGIGPADLLRACGVQPIVDAPEVGQNLLDHRYLATQYRTTGGSLNHRFAGVGLLGSLFSYLVRSKGPLTHAAHEVGGFVKTRPDLDHADAQIGVGLYSVHAGAAGFEVDTAPGMTILGYSTNPQSRGDIRIRSGRPDDAPIIRANHLAAEADRSAALSLFKWLRRLGEQPALRPWIVAETAPGPSIRSDDEILASLMSLGGTTHHVSGTARMGIDEAAVVDPQLRVRGVRGLRVVDTSIMPTIVSGNTNAPAMVIALRAAQFIHDAA